MNAKQLAQKLRRRCAAEFETDQVEFRKGDTFIEVDRGVEAGERGTRFEGYANFQIREVEAYGGDYGKATKSRAGYTNWACLIHVTPALDVTVEETHGRVPHETIACALSPWW